MTAMEWYRAALDSSEINELARRWTGQQRRWERHQSAARQLARWALQRRRCSLRPTGPARAELSDGEQTVTVTAGTATHWPAAGPVTVTVSFAGTVTLAGETNSVTINVQDLSIRSDHDRQR